MSSANLVALRRVAETVLGTTPATPALINTRYTRESLNFAISNTESREIRADRSLADLIQTGAEGSGDIEFELSYDSFNDYLESAFASTWQGAGPFTLTNGTAVKGFTVQKHFTDINQYFNFRGLVVNRFALNLSIGQIASGRFSGMFMSAERSGSQIAGATITPVNTNPVFSSVSNIGSILIDSVPYTGCINAFGLETNNNLRGTSCIGTLGFTDIKLGSFDVTGTSEIYFADGTMYDKFLNATSIGFDITLTDDLGNDYQIQIPKAKFQTAEVVAGGVNTDVMISTTWRGLVDSGISGVIKLTRTNA